MDNGWIKLHRKLMDWEWYCDSHMVHLFIHMLFKANHEPRKWKGESIDKGQFVSGREQLSLETGISEQSIRTCIERLKSTNEITIKSTNKFSVITVCNYCKYQSCEIDDQPSNQPAIQPTTNQQLTNNQPATNQQLTNNQPATNHKQELYNTKNYRELKKSTPLPPANDFDDVSDNPSNEPISESIPEYDDCPDIVDEQTIKEGSELLQAVDSKLKKKHNEPMVVEESHEDPLEHLGADGLLIHFKEEQKIASKKFFGKEIPYVAGKWNKKDMQDLINMNDFKTVKNMIRLYFSRKRERYTIHDFSNEIENLTAIGFKEEPEEIDPLSGPGIPEKPDFTIEYIHEYWSDFIWPPSEIIFFWWISKESVDALTWITPTSNGKHVHIEWTDEQLKAWEENARIRKLEMS
jgi:hypothetical protein